MKVVVAGGGTAGHVVPSIVVAERLREEGADVIFVGSPEGPEASMVPAAGFRFHAVRAAPFHRELSARALAAPVLALRSVVASRPMVRGSDAMLGMGGYASVGPVLAARSSGIPVVLHEQNAIPGLANRLLAHGTAAVALSFEESRPRFPRRTRTEMTGLPLRAAIRGVGERRVALADEARVVLGLLPDRVTALVAGGSQGALRLDRAVAGAIPLLDGKSDLQLLVLTGRAHEAVVEDVHAERGGVLVRAVPFLERMELALAVADLAVARAGANTIHELAACGVPSILVPYPHATANHQEANARALERAGAAEVVLDRDLTPERFAASVRSLAEDAERRARMGVAAAAWATPDAADRVAGLVRSVARR